MFALFAKDLCLFSVWHMYRYILIMNPVGNLIIRYNHQMRKYVLNDATEL